MAIPSPVRSLKRAIRVMIVDDSAVVRGLTRRWLEGEAGIELVKQCSDGAQAIADAAEHAPDVILLDVEMPKMDGLAALPQLKRVVPQAHIIMASSLTSEGASTTVRALSLGAADYIAKPEATTLGSADSYRKELIEKITVLGASAAKPVRTAGYASAKQFKLREAPRAKIVRPDVLVIASSTGGPQALQDFLTPIARRIEQPILIVQHMPASFTKVFAEKLGQTVGKPCREARDGDVLNRGTFLLAPGDFHMRVTRGGPVPQVKLDKGAPVNFCRPAADPMFESVSQIYKSRVAAIVLTGMGSDGANGAGTIVESGGRVAVQDEASSVVWGMPGAVAMAGHAEAVQPLRELSAFALNMMNGE